MCKEHGKPNTCGVTHVHCPLLVKPKHWTVAGQKFQQLIIAALAAAHGNFRKHLAAKRI
jgi:hypothetical protein